MAQISRTRACERSHLLLHICVSQPELAAVLGRAQKDVGVIELAADLLGNQPGLCHRLERAERARLAKRGVARPVRQLKGLRQRLDLTAPVGARPSTWRPASSACAAAVVGTRTADTTP